MVPAGAITEHDVPELLPARRRGRHDRRRRQLELPRLAAALREAGRGASTSSTPASRADLGAGGRLLPDGRRRRGAVQRLEPVFRVARAAGRIRARRRVGRRPLHEDGPQRDRVRADAGLRRGLRGDAGSPSSTSTSTRSPGSGATARSSARGCSSSCTRAFERRAATGRDQRLRRGLRRGPLDDRRGDRRERAGAGDHRRALRAVRLAPGRVVRRQGQRRAAQRVRRPRRAAIETAKAAEQDPRAERRPRTRCSRGCSSAAARSRASLVIFGASGDLARKLMPALYSLAVRRLLPEQLRDRRRGAQPRRATTSSASG